MGALDNSYPLLAEILRQNAYRFGLTVGESSREIRFANVPLSKLAADGIEAYAIAGAQDDRVEGDLQSIRNYRLEGPNPNNQEVGDPKTGAFHCTRATEETPASCTIQNSSGQPKWPYEPAACVAFGGESDKPEQRVEGASTKCDFKKLLLQAEADAQQHDIAGLVTIGESSASTEIKRDPVLGVVAHAESVARNIVIGKAVAGGQISIAGGQISIAEATASVDAWASGHKGKANTLYKRTFRGVRIGPPETPTFKCETVEECDPAKVLKAMNSVLGPRIQARLPKPDGDLLNGTKKGTAASLRQSFWEQLEERVLYDKPSEDLTMAAFELRITGNLRASSGIIVQLAGVTASTLYQISLKPIFEPLPILPPVPSIVPTTVVTLLPPVVAAKPQVVTKTVVDRLRTGSKLLLGFGGSTGLVLAAWALLLSPIYLAIRRRFLLRWTDRTAR
jgi:hypothetical protein